MDPNVGSEECKILDVCTALETLESYKIIIDKLNEIGLKLEVPSDQLHRIKKELTAGTMTSFEALNDILTAWTAKHSDKAKLSVFLNVLRRCGIGQAADALKKSIEGNSEKRKNVTLPPGVVEHEENKSNTSTSSTHVPTIATNPNTNISGRPRYYLEFGDKSLSKEIIPTISPEFRRMFSNKDTNDQIVTQIKALGVFEKNEINVLLTHQYKTQAERIGELMLLLEESDDEDILKCLEKLCNLQHLPIYSKKIREKFNQLLPGCVKENQGT